MTDKDLEELADEKAYEPSRPQRNTLSRGSMFEVTRRNMNDVLVTEDVPDSHLESSVTTDNEKKDKRSFWQRMAPTTIVNAKSLLYKDKDDPYSDCAEELAFRGRKSPPDPRFKSIKSGTLPSLKECQATLENEEAQAYQERNGKLTHQLNEAILNMLAALFIYVSNTTGFESVVMTANAATASWYYIEQKEHFAALTRLADFKACILSSSLFTFTVDWSSKESGLVGGRLTLPNNFNAQVLHDFREIVQLVYQYLSMPNVSHSRNVVFWSKQNAARRIHGMQNDIVKRLNVLFFDLSMHTEIMRAHGFPSGEASRLHQYHQYLQQRFEQLRLLKYYRTPQATRSFGRAYILLLPWLTGPYFVWVFESTSLAYAIILASFTFLVLLGLLHAQQSLEDPFVTENDSFTPGIDNVKLEFEMATVLQAMAQYYENSNLKQSYERHSFRLGAIEKAQSALHVVTDEENHQV